MLIQALSLARSGRVPEGLAILKQLAAQGEPEALFNLAEILWCGGPLPQDHARARTLYRLASEAGNVHAKLAYTNLLGSGIAGPRDWPVALQRLREEAKSSERRLRTLRLTERMDLDEVGDPGLAPAAERLSEAPFVSLHRAAFSAEECAYLLSIADSCYAPSLVGDGFGRQVRSDVRTSDTAHLHWLIEDPAIHALNRRLAAISGTSPEQGEPLQVLRYRPGQEYRPHIDWDSNENGRIMTALVYLNEDFTGGETHFVRTGLKAKGRLGDVLVFRSAAADGGLDPLSEHAGLPVDSGIKYIASRWIHAQRFAP